MVSGFERNNLANLVLSAGRRLVALVGDPAKVESAEKQVVGAVSTAMEGGWFKELKPPEEPLRGIALPAGFPSHNMSQASQQSIELHRDGYDEDDEDGEWLLDHAKETAAEFGLEIRVRAAYVFVCKRADGQILQPSSFQCEILSFSESSRSSSRCFYPFFAHQTVRINSLSFLLVHCRLFIRCF